MLKRILATSLLASVALGGCSRKPHQQVVASETKTLALVKTVAGELLSVAPANLQADVPLGHMHPRMDELDLVELVMELEDRLDVTISDEQLMNAAGTDKPAELLHHLTLRKVANVLENSKDTTP